MTIAEIFPLLALVLLLVASVEIERSKSSPERRNNRSPLPKDPRPRSGRDRDSPPWIGSGSERPGWFHQERLQRTGKISLLSNTHRTEPSPATAAPATSGLAASGEDRIGNE